MNKLLRHLYLGCSPEQGYMHEAADLAIQAVKEGVPDRLIKLPQEVWKGEWQRADEIVQRLNLHSFVNGGVN